VHRNSPDKSHRGRLPTLLSRGRVWPIDFTEFETSRGGTWRILVVVDYATKVCLATAVTGTSAARDAIESLELAIDEAERLIGQTLLEDCTEPGSDNRAPCVIVTDNIAGAEPPTCPARLVHDLARPRHVQAVDLACSQA
jgi:hypothetical protein